MRCVSCELELHYGCYNPTETDDCCCKEDDKAVLREIGELQIPRPVGRPRLDPEDMVDDLRAGRNRAGREIPIDGLTCAWAGLKAAGGGIRPIVGCTGNPVKARHHGPDKSTMFNELGVNLHLICGVCHNRWHAQNDKYYGPRPRGGLPFIPRPDAGECHAHDPESKATADEQLQNEIYWKSDKSKRKLIDAERALTEEASDASMVQADDDNENEERNENDELLGSTDMAAMQP
jgi:hypothetical protein